MTNDTAIESKKNQRKLYYKMGFILLLILLLLIPNAFISSLIHERSNLQNQTRYEIAKTWGQQQVITGPLLAIPYTTAYKVDGKTSYHEHIMYVSPDEVTINADVTTEERAKGIYSTILYTSGSDIAADFVLPQVGSFGSRLHEVRWQEAMVLIPISEPTNIISIVQLTTGGKEYKMKSIHNKQLGSVLSAVVDVADKKTVTISTAIESKGSESVDFVPSGASQVVMMSCDWPSPGFEGNMLPVERTITDQGFSARWTANEYSRPMPATWKDDEYQLRGQESFGVRLVQTVDHYQKNLRSVKYSLLIIVLSFLVFFFFEILKGRRIHPLQYILIGLALSLFYLLLLSMSEHIGFDYAYIIAAIGTAALVVWYSGSMLGAGRSVAVLGGTLAGLYSYIFVLLQMEDYALLAGSVGLFVILGIVMAISKRLNWYDQ